MRLWPLLRLTAGFFAALCALPAAQANFSFAISPPRFELSVKPGARTRQVIEISNAAPRANTLLIRTADWALRPDLAVEFQDELQPGSCRPWVAIERRELVVPPRQPYRFRFEVAPPADQAPVECRFAILLEGKDPSYAGETGSVPIGARVGVIVYVAVGDVKPELSVTGLRTEMRAGVPTAVLDIQNTGTAHGRLEGFLTGTDAKGQVLDVNPANTPVLPGETRSVPLSLSTRGTDQPATNVAFPLTVKGTLEWGKGRKTQIEHQFTQ